jgi:hypothetical protein
MDLAPGFGASATAWPFPSVGATVEYAIAADGLALGPGHELQVFTVGPSLREQTGGLYLQADLLFGGGRGTSDDGTIDVVGPPVPKHRLSGPAVTGNVGLFFHPASWS